MKKISSVEIPESLEDFVGGMGHLSIAHINANDLNFDLDVQGYISKEVDGVHYAEVMDGEGESEYACGSIDELQKWTTDTVHEFCKNEIEARETYD